MYWVFEFEFNFNLVYIWFLHIQVTLINVVPTLCSQFSAFHSLTVITCFNASSSSTTPSFTSSSFWKILFTLQIKLEVKEWVVEEREALKQVLKVKDRNMDNGLNKSYIILISVICFII